MLMITISFYTEGDFDPEMMLDQEEYMNFVGGEAGEAGKNIQQLLKESLVDKDFYNGMLIQ